MQIYNTICPVVWLNLLYSHGSEQGLLCTHFALLKYKKKKKKVVVEEWQERLLCENSMESTKISPIPTNFPTHSRFCNHCA